MLSGCCKASDLEEPLHKEMVLKLSTSLYIEIDFQFVWSCWYLEIHRPSMIVFSIRWEATKSYAGRDDTF